MADSEHLPPSVDVAIAEPARFAALSPLAPEYLEGEFREVPPRRLRDYLRLLSKHRGLAAGCFVGCLALTLLLTLLTPRSYTATAEIQVARSSPIKLQLKDNVLDLRK